MARAPQLREQERLSDLIVHIGLLVADGIENAGEHRRWQMHGDDPVTLGIELVGHAWVLETDEGEGVAVGIGERDLGAVVLVALLAAVRQDAALWP